MMTISSASSVDTFKVGTCLQCNIMMSVIPIRVSGYNYQLPAQYPNNQYHVSTRNIGSNHIPSGLLAPATLADGT